MIPTITTSQKRLAYYWIDYRRTQNARRRRSSFMGNALQTDTPTKRLDLQFCLRIGRMERTFGKPQTVARTENTAKRVWMYEINFSDVGNNEQQRRRQAEENERNSNT